MKTDNNTNVPELGSTALLACPFCGDAPELSTIGTYIEIDCCCHMSFQKSDYLTIEERGRWNDEEHKYEHDVEEKALKIAVAEWNRRAG